MGNGHRKIDIESQSKSFDIVISDSVATSHSALSSPNTKTESDLYSYTAL
jgi:hypothetical protein